jgi:hypothetical protein
MAMLTIAVGLGVTGSMFVVSAAHAITINTTARTRSPILACPPSTCTPTGGTNLVGDPVTSYCRVGTSDMVWNQFTGRKVGFVPRSSLNDTGQFTNCSSGGFLGSVASNTPMRTCSDAGCSSVGTAQPADLLRLYCQQEGGTFQGDATWYATFNNDGSNLAGYVPAARLNSLAAAPTCGSLF